MVSLLRFMEDSPLKRIPLAFVSLLLIGAACSPVPAAGPRASETTAQTPPPATGLPEATAGPTPQETLAAGGAAPESGEQVQWEARGVTAARAGTLLEGATRAYVLSAAAGQTLLVQAAGYEAPVEFILTGPLGEAWPGELSASEVYVLRAQAVLPEDGEYTIKLKAPPGAGATRYEITFTIFDSPPPTFPAPPDLPEQVEFTSEASSAQAATLLPTGLGVKQYLLPAREGQALTIDLTSDGVPLRLTLTSPSGMQRFAETSQVDGSYRLSYRFTLAETGDILVTLVKDEHTPSTNLRVDFVIQ